MPCLGDAFRVEYLKRAQGATVEFKQPSLAVLFELKSINGWKINALADCRDYLHGELAAWTTGQTG